MNYIRLCTTHCDKPFYIKEVNKNIKEIVKRENKIRIELDKIIQELEEDNE